MVSPALALGAPQTISLGPSRVSTWQTCSRSALGCGAAETMRATEKGASFTPGSSTCSTSSPACVITSASSAAESAVSKWSASQAGVNFMRGGLGGGGASVQCGAGP